MAQKRNLNISDILDTIRETPVFPPILGEVVPMPIHYQSTSKIDMSLEDHAMMSESLPMQDAFLREISRYLRVINDNIQTWREGDAATTAHSRASTVDLTAYSRASTVDLDLNNNFYDDDQASMLGNYASPPPTLLDEDMEQC